MLSGYYTCVPPAPNSYSKLSLPATSRFSIKSLSWRIPPPIYITKPNHPAPTIATSPPKAPFLLPAPVNTAGELDVVLDAEDVADVEGK